jgi:hypothetical protein
MTAILLAAYAPSPAPDPTTAEQVIANYQDAFGLVDRRCAAAPGEEEIVVCGKRAGTQPQRVVLPANSDRTGPVRGDTPTGMSAMNNEPCISRCKQPLSVNILAIPGFLKDVVERLKDD